MDKRKRWWIVTTIGLVVAIIIVVVLLLNNNDDPATSDGSNAQNFTATTQVAQGDEFFIDEYIGPTVEEVLAENISADDKAYKLLAHGLQQNITQHYDKATNYLESALAIEGISDTVRQFLYEELYAIAHRVQDTVRLDQYRQFIPETRITAIENL